MAKNGLNKVMLIGNLGRDPEQKFFQNGGSVCTFSLGTNESYAKNGEQKERTEWHNVVFLGKLAEIAGEYLSKGSNVYVEGALKTEKWENKEGNRKQATKIIGSKLIMLGERKKKEGREPGDEDDVPSEKPTDSLGTIKDLMKKKGYDVKRLKKPLEKFTEIDLGKLKAHLEKMADAEELPFEM